MQEPVTLSWNTEPLWSELSALLPGLSIEVVARCESSNTVLVDRARRSAGLSEVVPSRPGELEPPISGPMPLLEATRLGRRAGDTQPCLLVAEQQTRGRGRWGRSWQSSIGASLTCSLALPFTPPDWSGLSLAMGVALADALDPAGPRGGASIGLKWPNDLMRVEGTSAAAQARRHPDRIGAGRATSHGRHRAGPQRRAAAGGGSAHGLCLHAGVRARHRRAARAGADRQPWVDAVLQFQREGFAPFKARFERRDCLKGRLVTTTLDDLPNGVAEGIDASGALLVRVGPSLRTIGVGDVSVRASTGP